MNDEWCEHCSNIIFLGKFQNLKQYLHFFFIYNILHLPIGTHAFPILALTSDLWRGCVRSPFIDDDNPQNTCFHIMWRLYHCATVTDGQFALIAYWKVWRKTVTISVSLPGICSCQNQDFNYIEWGHVWSIHKSCHTKTQLPNYHSLKVSACMRVWGNPILFNIVRKSTSFVVCYGVAYHPSQISDWHFEEEKAV
jgi:hypothetical protein